MRIRRAIAAVLAAAFVVALPGTASASWLASGADVGKARATSVPAGPTPAASVTGRSVQVSWAPRSFGDGTPVEGYRVTRYDPGNTPSAATGGCTGTVTATSCTEQAAPPGTWRYTIRAVHAGWTGAEGGTSTVVVVDSPSLSWSGPTTFTALPANASGTIGGFVAGEALTFRLDDPSTGTVLAGSTTPDPVPADGSASVSVTIPAGTTDGTHDVFAVGDGGSVASAAILVDANAPTVAATTIAKSSGGVPGAIRPGGTYHVYANVSDGGSGVSVVTANVSTVTTGLIALPLLPGSWTIGATSYGYRSAVTIADLGLSAGTKNYTIIGIDLVGNASSPSPGSVLVDSTAPDGLDVQTANGGATIGKPEAGDVVTFTYTEAMEPSSLIGGWGGPATAVTVRIVQASGSDELEIWNAGNTTQLASFGSIRLGSGSFVTSTVSFTGSIATLSGDTLAVTLGAPSGATGTDASNAKMRWSVGTAATDVAGNACAYGNVQESGSNDPEF